MTDLTQLSDEQIQALAAQYTPAPHTAVQPLPQSYLSDPNTPEARAKNAAWEAQFGPTSGQSAFSLARAGVGQGMTNVVRHVGNLVGLESDQGIRNAKELDAPLLNTLPGRLGAIGGETSLIVPATMGGEMAAGTTALGTRILASPVLTGTLEGAGIGATMGDPGERAKSALVGALSGAAVPAATAIGKRLAYGLKRTPEAQLLLDQGVSLTPGQMNPKGSMNLIEQSADRVPGVGPLIDASRENAEQQFGRAVIQQGAAPGAVIKPSHNINDMFDQAAQSWDPIYAQVHGYPIRPVIMNQGANVPLSNALEQASRVPGLRAGQQRAINDRLQSWLQTLPGNPMSEDFIGRNSIRSLIRNEERNLGRAVNAGQTDAPLIREAYERAERAVTNTLESQLPADAATVLRNADQGYSQLKIIQNAVAAAKDNSAGLTPSKLSTAIAQSTDKSIYARGGGGPLRDLASAGTRVFETTVPPTGVRTAAALAAGGLGYTSPHLALPAMAAGGTGALLAAATPLGRRIAAGQTLPQTVAQKLIGALTSSTQPWQRELVGLTARSALNRAAQPYLLPSSTAAQPAQ